jgi:hypothetical protein
MPEPVGAALRAALRSIQSDLLRPMRIETLRFA